MRHQIEFNLPEDKDDLNTYMNVFKYHGVLYSMSQFLRSQLKHGDLTQKEHDIYDTIRTKFYEFIKDEELQDDSL